MSLTIELDKLNENDGLITEYADILEKNKWIEWLVKILLAWFFHLLVFVFIAIQELNDMS